MSEFQMRVEDALREYLKVKITFDTRDDGAVTAVGHELTSNMVNWGIAARKLVRHLFDHGITVYLAINRDGEVGTFLSPEAATRWLEDFPGSGSHIPRTETSQVFFR